MSKQRKSARPKVGEADEDLARLIIGEPPEEVSVPDKDGDAAMGNAGHEAAKSAPTLIPMPWMAPYSPDWKVGKIGSRSKARKQANKGKEAQKSMSDQLAGLELPSEQPNEMALRWLAYASEKVVQVSKDGSQSPQHFEELSAYMVLLRPACTDLQEWSLLAKTMDAILQHPDGQRDGNMPPDAMSSDLKKIKGDLGNAADISGSLFTGEQVAMVSRNKELYQEYIRFVAKGQPNMVGDFHAYFTELEKCLSKVEDLFFVEFVTEFTGKQLGDLRSFEGQIVPMFEQMGTMFQQMLGVHLDAIESQVAAGKVNDSQAKSRYANFANLVKACSQHREEGSLITPKKQEILADFQSKLTNLWVGLRVSDLVDYNGSKLHEICRDVERELATALGVAGFLWAKPTPAAAYDEQIRSQMRSQ